ncbi:MAG: hypothetical protein IKS10_06755 [Lachnospiraceae bacterium]|nr:hypothetical protein [Lachnospiraceae bacterium]
MSTIVEDKKILRGQMKTLRAGISEADHVKYRLQVLDWFRKICDNIDGDDTNRIQKPTALFSYIDIEREAPTRGTIEIALRKGVPVFLPKTFPNGVMVFVEVSDLSELTESKYHIPEPRIIPEKTLVLGRPEWEEIICGYVKAKIDYRDIFAEEYKDALMLVPGLAFSEEGYRLGYGGGFYDRYVSDAPFTTVAMAYDFQILPDIPREDHDAKCDKMYIIKTL